MVTAQHLFDKSNDDEDSLSYTDKQIGILRQALLDPEMEIDDIAEETESHSMYVRNVLIRADQDEAEEKIFADDADEEQEEAESADEEADHTEQDEQDAKEQQIEAEAELEDDDTVDITVSLSKTQLRDALQS